MKSWTCEICHDTVSEVGAYAKLTMTKYAHLKCVEDSKFNAGFVDGRRALLNEQNQAHREREEHDRKAHEEQQARERAEAERRQEIAERERTNRIIAQQNMPLPPKLEVKKPDAPKEEAPKPDRFQIIDLD